MIFGASTLSKYPKTCVMVRTRSSSGVAVAPPRRIDDDSGESSSSSSNDRRYPRRRSSRGGSAAAATRQQPAAEGSRPAAVRRSTRRRTALVSFVGRIIYGPVDTGRLPEDGSPPVDHVLWFTLPSFLARKTKHVTPPPLSSDHTALHCHPRRNITGRRGRDGRQAAGKHTNE